MFTPIRSAADFPSIDRDHESLILDFKATTEGSSPWENAKDAVAFADGRGGTNIVSAAEDRSRERLGLHRVMVDRAVPISVRVFDDRPCRPLLLDEAALERSKGRSR